MDLNSRQVSDQILKHDIQFNTDMNILSIGGSDPSSGAGIQSDIKTFSNHDVYGFTVVTAITSQNTKKVTSIEPVSTKSLIAQLDSILSDFHVDAIKIGMVYNSQIIKVIHSKLRKFKAPIIVDPIIKSTTNATLLKKNALHDYKKMIIPLADVITPNKYEAKVLSGISNIKKSAKKIQTMGAKCVIITGATSSNGKISDFILEENKITTNEPTANFFLMNFDKTKINSDEAFEKLANKRLILRKMVQYKIPNSLRLTIGNEQANEHFIQVIGSIIK